MAATNLGDLTEDQTVTFMWNTNAVAGESVTRTTDGTVCVYKNASDTPSTAGVTDTEDADGLTGVHRCVINTSADAFYATGADYMVVLVGATIDTKAVNAVIAYFSIQNRYGSSSAPTAAAIADAVWDEDATGHQTQGTFGQVLGDSGATATSVWSRVTTALPNAAPAGSGGLLLLGTTNTAGVTVSASSGNAVRFVTTDASVSALALEVSGSGSNALSLSSTSVIAGTGIAISVSAGRGINVSSTDDALRLLDDNGGSGISANDLDIMERIATAMFLQDSGVEYGDAVAGSVVKEITDNTPGGTGATTGQIADAVWDEARAGHVAAGSFGEYVNATPVTGSITASVIATGAIDSDALAASALAAINAEVVDTLNTDTYAQPTGVPAATVSLAAKIGRLYQALTSELTVTSTAKTFYTHGGAALWVKTLADDGSVYSETDAASP